jgi:hypothetical protein
MGHVLFAEMGWPEATFFSVCVITAVVAIIYMNRD